MKVLSRHLGWLIPALCVLVLAIGEWRATRPSTGIDLRGFGMIPVVSNGRVQPLDSLARNRLLAIHGKQGVPGENAPTSPAGWLAELAFRPEAADQRPIFLIHHDELLGLLELRQGEGDSFSFVRLAPRLAEMAREASRIAIIESKTWTPYEKALMQLWRNLGYYQQLKFALAHPESSKLESDLTLLLEKAGTALDETDKRARGEQFDASLIDAAAARMQVLLEWSSQTDIFTQPPPAGGLAPEWRKLPDAAIEAVDKGSLHPSALAFARIGDAWRASEVTTFNAAVSDYHSWLEKNRPDDLRKSRAESAFNRLAPFYVCMALYVVAFLCAVLSWLSPGDELRRAAFRVLLIGLAIHTIGLVVRMSLEGRPPVTNLYSSAVFIGWGAIVFSMVLELFHKNAIGTAVASMTGFATLVIAHHLSLSGDTLEMMRAVLDSNFWLATHVIVITLGYSATFLAGVIAIVYLIRHAFGGVPGPAASAMRGMVYGTLCFATLASFIGTVLGGIWADQSWGRFWGWDPKENGALLIVLWNAIILHARWGGMIREKGMMVMAVFGNIVTSWSWFGTNMLGIGLHSYGFTDAAFFWLSTFMISQVLVMALGLIPRRTPVSPSSSIVAIREDMSGQS
jgi:ABC-type transport system involved in cytochrome c biogenesis permease subunit